MDKGIVVLDRIYCFDDEPCTYEFDDGVTSCIDNCPYYAWYNKKEGITDA